MATIPTIVLTMKCGSTLKTTVNGVAVEVQSVGDSDSGWTPPSAPDGSGGVVAYVTAADHGPRLDLSLLAERFQAGDMGVANMPEVEADSDWAVFADEFGQFRSMREMTTDE